MPVRICEGRCPVGLAVEEDGNLWAGTHCSAELARTLGMAVGEVEDPCAIGTADRAVEYGDITAQAVFEGSKA